MIKFFFRQILKQAIRTQMIGSPRGRFSLKEGVKRFNVEKAAKASAR